MKTRLATLTAIPGHRYPGPHRLLGWLRGHHQPVRADHPGNHGLVDTHHHRPRGNEVTLPEKVTRVAIDQIPIESTYLAYFDGKAPTWWA